MNANWSKISLTFFFIIALLGSIIRLSPFTTLFIDYDHLLHAHSHVAFQGWVYTALFLLITKLYLTDKLIEKGKYKSQYLLTLLTLLGIMVAFIIQGYGLFSILFSSLFQILNYWFAYRFFKDVKTSKRAKKHLFSLKFIRIGFWMMILSTIGPWAVGVLSTKGLAGSEYFDAALYFFLHFQYNGWFTFAILGLFFWLLEHYNIPFKQKEATLFYILFTTAIIPAYSLSLLGMSFRPFFIAFGYVSASLQLIALFYLIKSLSKSFQRMRQVANKWVFLLLVITAIAFTFKIVLQFVSILPFLETLAFGNRFLIIGYIHLIMIGFISFFILAIFFQLSFIKNNTKIAKLGIIALIFGFIGSKLILLGLSLSLPIFNGLFFLLISSTAMALGILLILIGPQTSKSTLHKK